MEHPRTPNPAPASTSDAAPSWEESEAAPWRDAGFDPGAALEWRKTSMGRLAAMRWSAAGLSTDEAPEWSRLGIGPRTAARWRTAGFCAVEAAAWTDERFTVVDAQGWHTHGFNAAEARDLIDEYRIKDPAVAHAFRHAEAQSAVDVDARLAATMIHRGQLTDEQLAAMTSEKGWPPAGGGSTLFYDAERGQVTARSHKSIGGRRHHGQASLDDVAERDASRQPSHLEADSDRRFALACRLLQGPAGTSDPGLHL